MMSVVFSIPVMAQETKDWSGETFLTDYSLLKPMPTVEGREGKDWFYVAADVTPEVLAKYGAVMVDQPEVFISPKSPYKGAKPDDLAAIAKLFRETAAAAIADRGFQVVDQPGPNTLLLRIGLTDLQIVKKKRGLLAYTPIGFVVSEGVKALQGFMDKYDILDIALQAEVNDATTGKVMGAAVLQRGKSVDKSKPIKFEAMVVVVNEQAERFACRLENGRVAQAQRINCFDPAARKNRPKIVTQ